MSDDRFPGWYPAEITTDLLEPRGNRLREILGWFKPKYERRADSAMYAITLLIGAPENKEIWRRVEKTGLSALDVFWLVDQVMTENHVNRQTKKMTKGKLQKWELEVKQTARELSSLVKGTPYDQVLEEGGLKTSEGGILDFSDLLDIVATTKAAELADVESYTRDIAKPNVKKAVRTEMIIKGYSYS